MRAIIFANGELNDHETILATVQADDLVIAADGGTLHCLELGINPELVVGDFDSLDDEHFARLQKSGTRLIGYPRRKDFTDLELAIQHAHAAGVDEVLILGALGNRWDQTLANLLLPASESFRGLKIRLIDGAQEIFLIRSGETGVFQGEPGDTVSLIPLGGDACGITTEGLEYPLEDGTLRFGSTTGVSNVLVENPAQVFLESGILWCTIIHEEHGE